MRLVILLGGAMLALAACGAREPQVTTPPKLETARLDRDMNALVERAKPAELGAGVMDIRSGAIYTVNGALPFPMQSVFKALLAAAVLAEVDAGRLRLDETISLEAKDLSPPYSPISAAWPGRKDYTVAELLVAAAGRSDNTAADVLMKRIGGPGAVTAWLRFNDFTELTVDRYERQLQPEIVGMASFRPAWKDEAAYVAALRAVPEADRAKATAAYLADPRDTATPRAMLAFLRRLHDGELLSGDSTRRLMQIMTQTETGRNRLKAGLPQGAVLAHKTGSARTDLGMNPATNDVGVVTLPDGSRYAIVVFLKGSNLDEAAREDLIADVAEALIGGIR